VGCHGLEDADVRGLRKVRARLLRELIQAEHRHQAKARKHRSSSSGGGRRRRRSSSAGSSSAGGGGASGGEEEAGGGASSGGDDSDARQQAQAARDSDGSEGGGGGDSAPSSPAASSSSSSSSMRLVPEGADAELWLERHLKRYAGTPEGRLYRPQSLCSRAAVIFLPPPAVFVIGAVGLA
jgi:hypothetical protein